MFQIIKSKRQSKQAAAAQCPENIPSPALGNVRRKGRLTSLVKRFLRPLGRKDSKQAQAHSESRNAELRQEAVSSSTGDNATTDHTAGNAGVRPLSKRSLLGQGLFRSVFAQRNTLPESTTQDAVFESSGRQKDSKSSECELRKPQSGENAQEDITVQEDSKVEKDITVEEGDMVEEGDIVERDITMERDITVDKVITVAKFITVDKFITVSKVITAAEDTKVERVITVEDDEEMLVEGGNVLCENHSKDEASVPGPTLQMEHHENAPPSVNSSWDSWDRLADLRVSDPSEENFDSSEGSVQFNTAHTSSPMVWGKQARGEDLMAPRTISFSIDEVMPVYPESEVTAVVRHENSFDSTEVERMFREFSTFSEDKPSCQYYSRPFFDRQRFANIKSSFMALTRLLFRR